MSFDWDEYLNLAQDLYSKTNSASEDAQFRSAISRAYYAAYHKAKEHLENVDKIVIPKKIGKKYINSHSFVREKFQNSSDPNRKIIGDRLDKLRKKRNDADYYNNKLATGLEKTTKQVIIYAKEVITLLASL